MILCFTYSSAFKNLVISIPIADIERVAGDRGRKKKEEEASKEREEGERI